MKLLSIGLNEEEGHLFEVAWKPNLLRGFGMRLGGSLLIGIMRIKGRVMHCFRSR